EVSPGPSYNRLATARIDLSDIVIGANRLVRSPGIFQPPEERDLFAIRLWLYRPWPCRFCLYQPEQVPARSHRRARPTPLSGLAFGIHSQALRIVSAHRSFFRGWREWMRPSIAHLPDMDLDFRPQRPAHKYQPLLPCARWPRGSALRNSAPKALPPVPL